MINGEGTSETVSKVASPNSFDSSQPWRAQESEGGDAASPESSRYSSCGESEFDRYCSANSAMGTPSMCSTITVFNEFTESEYGAIRNFGFGDDSDLENFSLGGSDNHQLSTKFLGIRNNHSSKGIVDGDSRVAYGSGGLDLYDNSELTMLDEDNHEEFGENMCWKVGSRMDIIRGEKLNGSCSEFGCNEDENNISKGGVGTSKSRKVVSGVVSSAEDGGLQGSEGIESANDLEFRQRVEERSASCIVHNEADSGFNGLNLQFHLQSNGRDEDKVEDVASTSADHSEGEDSVFNYCSDDKHKDDGYLQRYKHYQHDRKLDNENPLLINSSVAFGTDDWSDFMYETEGSVLDSLTLDTIQGKKQENLNSSLATLTGSSSTRQTGKGEYEIEMPVGKKEVDSTGLMENIHSSPGFPAGASCLNRPQEVVDARDIPVASYQVSATADLAESMKSSFVTEKCFLNMEPEQEAKHIHLMSSAGDARESAHASTCPLDKVFRTEQDRPAENAPLVIGKCIMDISMENTHQNVNTEEIIGVNDNQALEKQGLENSRVKVDPPSDLAINRLCTRSSDSIGNTTQFLEDLEPKPTLVTSQRKLEKISSIFGGLSKDRPVLVELENLEPNEHYDEVVHEMEEILLDCGESPGPRFSQGSKVFQSQPSLPLRDGGSTASTSSTNDAYLLNQQPPVIDGVEVVGARQKQGDVSFSERLVGLKEFTVYKIRVQSGTDQWEVERRYRDFYYLYCRLKSLFADRGWSLPPPWSSIGKESRKIFGNASPDVIAERSVIIQECLSSVLQSRYLSTSPSALIWFLSPENSSPSSPASSSLMRPSSFSARGEEVQKLSPLGNTISLIVEIRPYKSMKQMLDTQHYTCAGCHRHFDDGRSLMQGFVQTFGWGKPRLCDYTGQLFCSSCHTNDTAVIPARVLHHWDFTQYPVSQLAKSYLDSINDQPMLCVSAVNPFLFSKVPALLHVMGVRKKIRTMLPYVRCPFRKTINKGLGSRRYLLESNDFFALKDLIDLSRGAFAALPVKVETVSRKILKHIVEQCLICCDLGVPCSARQACSDPSSLIFPFQEGEIERCTSCESVFHKPCFRKLTSCPCGASLRVDERAGLIKNTSRISDARADISGAFGALGRKSSSVLDGGFLSGLFTKAKPENTDHTDSDDVILMGSLPTTSL